MFERGIAMLKTAGLASLRCTTEFFRKHWIGTVLLLAATMIFFWPMITRLDSYSPGGDAMFNAWIIQRNQHCILQQECPNYFDANIYFPNKDTMLYSETQFTPGLLTLPLHWLNDNPLFAYNTYTILMFFFNGWFMYLLVKRLSKGNEFVSVLAGFVFAFAPFKMAAIFHMQNMSIYFLPLATLITLKFFEKKNKWYLLGLLIVLSLLFYSSWNQMVFAGAIFALILLGMLYFKLANWKLIAMVGVTVAMAALTTAPMAVQYLRFSKEHNASFPLSEQLLYESSLADYTKPHDGTLLGKLYYKLHPAAIHNAYNLDSYSYHGLVLYLTAIVLIVVAFRRRKQSADERLAYKWIVIFAVTALVGFVLSLGPLLKIHGTYLYSALPDGQHATIMMPYMLIDKFLPQLSFIRAVGRWSILVLFALCCLLAYVPLYLRTTQWGARHRRAIYWTVAILAVIELAPLHRVAMTSPTTNPYNYNMKIPEVYHFVKQHPEINDIVIIEGDPDYPHAPIPVVRAEWVLWAGYHNRNIFNGYSGYEPKGYMDQYIDFKDLDAKDIVKMRQLGLRYVIIDKQLSTMKPELITNSRILLPQKLYEDQRYILYKVPN